MASLQDIMNADEDQVDSYASNKSQVPSSFSRYNQPYHAPSPTYNNSVYATGSQQPDIPDTIKEIKKRSPSSGVPRSYTAAPSPSGRPTVTRRRSNISTGSMDPSNYGHSYAGLPTGGYDPSSAPTRPFTSQPTGGDVPVKLTPITGRVSRAKKGMKVHTCDICRPPKTFTRAEHLRRHQLSHETPQFACSLPGCDRAFHRKDLLERHQQRHELEGDKTSRSGVTSQSRRTSAVSSEGGVRGLGLHPSVLGYPPNAISPTHSLPMTPNMSNSGSYQSISAPDVRRPMSPHAGNDYGASPGSHVYGGGYTFSGTQSQHAVLQRSPSNGFDSAPAFSATNYDRPRTIPESASLYLRTEGLGLHMPESDGPPELSHAQDPAGWTSSASDSAYSTPSDISRRAVFWPTAGTNNDWQENLLPTYSEAGFDAVAITNPLFYQFPASPQMANPQFPMLGVSVAGFPDENTLLDPHQPPRVANTVRSPTPQMMSASAQCSETLVTPSTALPSDRMMNSLACLGRQKEVALGLLAAPALMQGPVPLPPANASKAIPNYLELYWEKVHHIFPIVHRETFEAAAEHVEVLRCAMAAIATQYMSNKEDRIRGNQLHEYASHQSRRFLQWNVPDMQTILLCEFFARFRGRQAAIKPSKEFESLFSRVSDKSVIFGTTPMTGPNTVRWHTWVDMETRRRLLAACFVLDVHGSVYLEQQRVREFDIAAGRNPTIPLIGPTADLWDAPSADAWAAMVVSQGDSSDEPTLVSHANLDTLSATSIDAYVPFDRAVILAFKMMSLPALGDVARIPPSTDIKIAEPETYRMANMFPECPVANTYLALHYTPLHDLLAVSGDSWMFGKKLLQPKAFAEHQKRLNRWCDSGSAAVAMVFACRALHAFIKHGNAEEDSDDSNEMDASEISRPRMWKDDISDFWAMYVCTLICWANGHKTSRINTDNDNNNNQSEYTGEKLVDKSVTLQWMCSVAGTHTADMLKPRSINGAVGVVTLVRKWLETDCVGGRSRLYIDAIGVLKKLEE